MIRRRHQGVRSSGSLSRSQKRRERDKRLNRRLYWAERLEDRWMLAVTAPVASGLQADTFLLHSLPGYSTRTDLKTVYLDFTGQNTTGTIYNSTYNTSTIFTPVFDVDGDPTNFNAEWQIIQLVWEHVSELLRPFDIDVTTQDPTTTDPGALTSSGGQDQSWGIRMLIGGSQNDWFTPNGGGAFTGIAFMNTFKSSTEVPAFAFSDQLVVSGLLGVDPIATANNISLDTAFNFGTSTGLKSDGQNRYYTAIGAGVQTKHDTYFTGQALTSDTSTFDPVGNTFWSPSASWESIMGADTTAALTQWTNNQYYNADGNADALATITSQSNGITYRIDDHVANLDSTADPLTVTTDTATPGTYDDLSGSGIIETNTDKDAFSFTVDGLGGAVQLSVNPFVNLASYAGSESLDIRANIYNANGVLIATSNPLSDLAAGSSTVADTFYQSGKTGVTPTTQDPTAGWQVQLNTSVSTPTYTDSATGDIYGVVSQHPVGDLTDINNSLNSRISQLILPQGTYYVSIEGGSRPLTYLDGSDEAFLKLLTDPALSKQDGHSIPKGTVSSIHPGPLERFVNGGTPGYWTTVPDPNDKTGMTMIEKFVAAPLPTDNSDYGYSNYGSLGYYSITGKISKNLVVGVDFDKPTGTSPTNWNQFTGGAPTELTNLISESGSKVPYTLTIASSATNITTVGSTHAIDPAEVPTHGVPLKSVDGYITAPFGTTLTFTWNNLTPNAVYQVYVFGSSSQNAENDILVTGGTWNGIQQSFPIRQYLTPGVTAPVVDPLIVNNNGPGSQDLETYAIVVVSNDTGQITITATGAEGKPVAIAGLAIAPTKVGSITGTKFDDENGNGIQDTGEPGLPGWVVYLDLNNDGQLNTTTAENTTVTAPHVPQPITDFNGDIGGSTTKNQLDVVDAGTILSLTVTLNITHEYDADLRVWLVSPLGTQVQLFANVGSYAQNFPGTTFDDSAPVSVTQLTPTNVPFSGTYRPEEPLSTFAGQNAQGTWTLLVLDDASGDTGVLNSWSLTVKTAGLFLEPHTTTDANGNYTFDNLPAGPYYVREHFSDAQTAAGWKQSIAPAPVNVNSGANVKDIDFGNWIPVIKEGSINGQIFTDTDGDGFKDTNEQGLNGWIAYIDANNNGIRDVPTVPTTITSTDVPKTITDFSTVNSQVQYDGLGTVFSIKVNLDITHSFVGDLDAFLISPSGRQVELFSAVGGQYNNFHNLTLDDNAARSITSLGPSDVPYSGTFQPEGHLSDFTSDDAAGTWTLQIRDTQQFDEGILNSWSLIITAGEEFRTADGDGSYSFVVPAGSYVVREEAPQGATQIPPATKNIPAAVWSGGQWLVTVVGADDPINSPADSHRNVKNVNFGNQIAQPLAGDFNRSGGVDMLDYVLWRKSLGTSVGNAFAGADGNGDGVVNNADYGVWRSNFGKIIDDFGNDAATANAITSVPATRHGTIEVAGDVDWFAFTATKDQTFDISTTLGTLSDTVLRLIDVDGQSQIASNDNANGLASEIQWTVPVDGTYYVEVRGAASLTGTYSLTLQPTNDDHGNSPAAATPVLVGSSTAGEIEIPGDEDWFKFTGIATKSYSFDVVLNSLVDSQLWLYDSNGTTILANNDDGSPKATYGYASHIDWTLTNSGTYFLKVIGYGSDLGTYHLKITQTSAGSGASLGMASEEALPSADSSTVAFAPLSVGPSLSLGTTALQSATPPTDQTGSSDAALLAWVASQPQTVGTPKAADADLHSAVDHDLDSDLADSVDSVFDRIGAAAISEALAV